QAEDGIRDLIVTGVQTCALPISLEQIPSEASASATASRLLERAALSARVPAGIFRNELSAAAFPEGAPRPHRRVLHTRLQPGVEIGRASCRKDSISRCFAAEVTQ